MRKKIKCHRIISFNKKYENTVTSMELIILKILKISLLYVNYPKHTFLSFVIPFFLFSDLIAVKCFMFLSHLDKLQMKLIRTELFLSEVENYTFLSRLYKYSFFFHYIRHCLSIMFIPFQNCLKFGNRPSLKKL